MTRRPRLRQLFRPPSPERITEEQQAMLAGRPVEVGCYLKADHRPLPRRGRQGVLVLGPGGVTWRTGALRRRSHELPTPALAVTERPVGRGPSPLFRAVSCQLAGGTVELTVPAADAPLVRSFFTPR